MKNIEKKIKQTFKMKPNQEEIIKKDAKAIVDLLYETGALRNGLTRDNMNALEEYIRVLLDSRVNSHIRMVDLNRELIKTR